MSPNIDFLKQHLLTIARPRDAIENRQSLLEVESYIEKQFQSFGYKIEKDPFQFQGDSFNNVIAYQNRSESKSCFIIGAHFDAVPGTDGADDNASGVAVLLESARLLAQSQAASQINFIAFNIEERGITGSSHYVAQLKKKQIKLAGMISLEMVGFTSQNKGSQQMPLVLRPFYPDVGNFLALVGDSQSKTLLDKAQKAFQKVKGLPVETLSVPAKGWLFPDTRLSDHSPFWDAGYPALLITDTSFFRNPHYHTAADRVETLDLEFMARVTEGVVRFANSSVFSI